MNSELATGSSRGARSSSSPSAWWTVWRRQRGAVGVTTAGVVTLAVVAVWIEGASRWNADADRARSSEPVGGDYHFTAFAAGVLLALLLLAPTVAGAVMGARAWSHELGLWRLGRLSR